MRVMHHQDFNMFGTKIGDTAYYDPELHSRSSTTAASGT